MAGAAAGRPQRAGRAPWRSRRAALPPPPQQRHWPPQGRHDSTSTCRTQGTSSSSSAPASAPVAPPRPVRELLSDYPHWPASAKVAARTGVYITTLGAALFVWPGLFGLLFNASRVAAGWVRVGGMLAALFGFYYVGAALDDAEGRPPLRFYQSTVLGRLALATAFTGLAAARQVEPALLLLAAANAVSAAAMARSLKRPAQPPAQGPL